MELEGGQIFRSYMVPLETGFREIIGILNNMGRGSKYCMWGVSIVYSLLKRYNIFYDRD